MEISSKVINPFFDVIFCQCWILGIFGFRSEVLDSIPKVKMCSSRVDGIIDNLRVSHHFFIWIAGRTLLTSKPFLIHLMQLLMICQLALAAEGGFRWSGRALRGVIPLIDIDCEASRPSFIHRCISRTMMAVVVLRPRPS